MTASTTSAPPAKRRVRVPGFAQLQRLGKSLMLPIALLPAAGILLRLGQEDLLGHIEAPVIGPFFDAMSAAGNAIFGHLPLLFAVGVAIGFAKKADGATALSAVAGYLVIEGVFTSMSPVVLAGVVDNAGDQATINYGVFAGIIVGLVDTLGRTFLPMLIRVFADREVANAAGPALASMLIYVLMAVILAWRPQGLFPANKAKS